MGLTCDDSTNVGGVNDEFGIGSQGVLAVTLIISPKVVREFT